MYYFYQPIPTRPEQDPLDRNPNKSKLHLADKDDHIQDSFSTLQSVSEAILAAGMSKASLVLGIDLTASNEWQGRITFSRNSLHKMHPVRTGIVYNPYQRVISIIGKTLHPFTEAGKVFAYGFGDVITQDISVFNIMGDEGAACSDFKEVLVRYNEVVKDAVLSGPTSFAPRKESGNKFHVLVIIADGQMEVEGPTVSAIIDASKLPLPLYWLVWVMVLGTP